MQGLCRKYYLTIIPQALKLVRKNRHQPIFYEDSGAVYRIGTDFKWLKLGDIGGGFDKFHLQSESVIATSAGRLYLTGGYVIGSTVLPGMPSKVFPSKFNFEVLVRDRPVAG